MKNLNEIMMQMDNLSEQIAVSLSDEVTEDVKEQSTQCCGDSRNSIGPKAITCTSNDINFCAYIDFPKGFQGTTSGAANPRILYNLSCLKCVVEETCQQVVVTPCPNQTAPTCISVPQFNVRVIGCIPFIVNVAVKNTPIDKICAYPTVPGSEPTVYGCWHDSICVDKVVCTKCSKATADAACAYIMSQLSCSGIDVNLNTTTCNNTNDCYYCYVTGCFRLPTCP